MIAFFPKTIANKGLLIYVLSVVLVSFAFMNYFMGLEWVSLGVLEVALFFLASSVLTKRWKELPTKLFLKYLFWTALGLRIVWVFFSYYFYTYKTGVPFEFDAADAIAYHEEGQWLSQSSWKTVFNYLFLSRSSYSDSGYYLYLTLLYKIFGDSIIITRLLKAVYSSVTCVLIYRLTSRSMDEKVARMASVFTMLMPNLIIYCGLHLKETEMLFLIVLFLERADYVLRSKHFKLLDVLLPIFLALSLFLFRTPLGVVALFSFVTALIFSPDRVLKKGRKFVIGFWVVLTVAVLAGGTIMNEVEEMWRDRGSNQETKRLEQTSRGNQWAKYATGTVMAPMVFVLPFSTMVNTDQENQLVLHGGNYIRNLMGVFAIITLFTVFFVKKNWRDFALIGSFVIGYLGVISLSGFANSERFLLPGLPVLIIFWAYGIYNLNAKNYRLVKYWYIIVPVMEIAWAFFKIGSRGLLG